MRRILGVMPCCVLLVAGCATKLPTHEWGGVEYARAVMAQRAEGIGDISAACELTLTDERGESVTLEGVLVARGDTHLRLRAWKFNQAVMDVTVNEGGLYLWVRERNGREVRDLRLGPVVEAWSLMSGRVFTRAPSSVVEHGDVVELSYPLDAASVTAVVDRATLTVRRYTVADERKQVRQTLKLDKYALVAGVPWAMRVVAEGEGGRVSVRLRDVDLHADLPAGAFVQPPGAERVP